MSRGQNKYWIPKGAVQSAIYLIQTHKERIKEYSEILSDIAYASPCKDGMPKGSGTSDPTGNKALKLLEKTPIMDIHIRAVDNALHMIDPVIRGYLIDGIECEAKYEDLFNVPCGRRQWYEDRRKLIWGVAYYEGII